MNLLFDIGGTTTRFATVAEGSNLNNIESIPTPKNFTEGVGRIADYAKKFGGQFDYVSGGFPGTFDKNKEIILRAPNLPGWENCNLRDKLTDFFRRDVYFSNDADLAGLGEATEGAGKDFNIVAYITISTGVGGVRIVNKKIDIAAIGFEPGHQIIDADTTIRSGYIESKNGDRQSYLEDLVSGKNINNIFGDKPENIDDPNVWDEVHWLLAVGLNNTIVHWSPEIVVIGGGLGSSDKISLEKLSLHLSKYLKVFPEIPVLKKSVLGDTAGLIGALTYFKQKIG